MDFGLIPYNSEQGYSEEENVLALEKATNVSHDTEESVIKAVSYFPPILFHFSRQCGIFQAIQACSEKLTILRRLVWIRKMKATLFFPSSPRT